MTYGLTIFKSIFDNKTHKRMDFATWADFETLLYRLSGEPGYKAKRDERTDKASPLISPAVFKPGTTRANANVECWASWAALDVDDCSVPLERVSEAMTQYEPYHYVCYSTASSRPEKLKFRLVFPLSGPVPADRIRHFWYALNKEFQSAGDEQCKDLSRMYYVPAKYPDATNFIFTHAGEDLNPTDLMGRHEFLQRSGSFLDKLPKEMRDQILAERKARLTNTGVTWTSYRDCPFVNKGIISDYKRIANIDGTGRYRMTYRIMSCIAMSAIRHGYPITSSQIAEMVRQLDAETSRIYQKRPLALEAERAIEYAYRHATPTT